MTAESARPHSRRCPPWHRRAAPVPPRRNGIPACLLPRRRGHLLPSSGSSRRGPTVAAGACTAGRAPRHVIADPATVTSCQTPPFKVTPLPEACPGPGVADVGVEGVAVVRRLVDGTGSADGTDGAGDPLGERRRAGDGGPVRGARSGAPGRRRLSSSNQYSAVRRAREDGDAAIPGAAACCHLSRRWRPRGHGRRDAEHRDGEHRGLATTPTPSRRSTGHPESMRRQPVLHRVGDGVDREDDHRGGVDDAGDEPRGRRTSLNPKRPIHTERR